MGWVEGEESLQGKCEDPSVGRTMTDRERKHSWALRRGQDSPGLCRLQLVFGLILTMHHMFEPGLRQLPSQ